MAPHHHVVDLPDRDNHGIGVVVRGGSKMGLTNRCRPHCPICPYLLRDASEKDPLMLTGDMPPQRYRIVDVERLGGGG